VGVSGWTVTVRRLSPLARRCYVCARVLRSLPSAPAEMVRISAALKHFSDMPSRNSRILEDTLERCRARESHCRAAARRQMQTYGLLYKQGHFVKNWQTRLFILSGGQLKYYVPGDTEAKGTIMLHHIKSVVAHTVRRTPSLHRSR
jgi:hypothetical protein